jgi:hypothetical protein
LDSPTASTARQKKPKAYSTTKKQSAGALSKFKCVVQVRYDVRIAIEDKRDIVEGFPFIIWPPVQQVLLSFCSTELEMMPHPFRGSVACVSSRNSRVFAVDLPGYGDNDMLCMLRNRDARAKPYRQDGV